MIFRGQGRREGKKMGGERGRGGEEERGRDRKGERDQCEREIIDQSPPVSAPTRNEPAT